MSGIVGIEGRNVVPELAWCLDQLGADWVPVRGFNLSYHDKETIFFTNRPLYYGNLNKIPYQEPSRGPWITCSDSW